MHEGSSNPRLKQEVRLATDLAYGRRKSQRSPSGRRCPHLWSKRAIYGSALLRGAISTKCAFSMLSSPRLDGSATLSRTVQQFSAVQKQTEAIQHILPRHEAPSATAPPQGKPQSARRRGRPPVSSRAAPPRGVLSPRLARRASCRSAAPPVFQLAPISSRRR